MDSREKIGRNELCPCDSGHKFKHCHGLLLDHSSGSSNTTLSRSRLEASEYIRRQQQGSGRPIIALNASDQQIVVVGNRIYSSDKWLTFIDFLEDYVKQLLGPDWGNSEMRKPYGERHTLLQWYETKGLQQQASRDSIGAVKTMSPTGASAAYYSLAYGLYLLAHNVELQAKLLNRIRDPRNFQGAYYEVLIANILIRAGFELVLEDEDDRTSKHCEFAAISKQTGERYWIEAKMKAVDGLLGKTSNDGSADPNPTSHLIRHITGALAKPADAKRLIFIDMNAEFPADLKESELPNFFKSAERRLIKFEQSNESQGFEAYVFLTNLTFHRRLDDHPTMLVMPFGLNKPDFNRPRVMSVSDAYKLELKHVEALNITNAFGQLLVLPATFNGELPAEVFNGARAPVKLGQSYCFEGIGVEGGVTGAVTTATVVESEKAAYIGIRTSDGRSMILKESMSDAQLIDYRAHGDAYFGEVGPVPQGIETPLKYFKFLMNAYSKSPRETLIGLMAGRISGSALAAMSDEDLRITYCEGMTSAKFPQSSRKVPI